MNKIGLWPNHFRIKIFMLSHKSDNFIPERPLLFSRKRKAPFEQFAAQILESLFFIFYFFYSPSLLLSLPSPFSSPFIFFCVFLIVFRTDLCFSIINELEATPARGPSFPPPFCNESQRINLHQINFSRTKKHHSLFWQFIVRQIFAKFLILFFKGFVHGHAEQTTPFFLELFALVFVLNFFFFL